MSESRVVALTLELLASSQKPRESDMVLDCQKGWESIKERMAEKI
jgi:hypothetical protein